jgi:hypothetical protein
MADVTSILSAAYKSAGAAVPSKTKYVAVDPKLYQGTWSGTYANKKKFSITVSEISGFRAQARYQSDDGTAKYQSVLIKDGSFRVGDTKFYLATAATATKPATATIKNVVTDPATGSTFLDTATATQS